MVNCLNTNQTGFPQLTLNELKELSGGPYTVNLAPSYLSSYRVRQADTLAYINLATYHQQRTQALVNMPGWVFDQQAVPNNWFGVWPGCTTQNVKPWEPIRIMVLPKIPSRYKSNCDHSVSVAYVPSHLPVQHPTPGFSTQNLQRIKMWFCGPRYRNTH